MSDCLRKTELRAWQRCEIQTATLYVRPRLAPCAPPVCTDLASAASAAPPPHPWLRVLDRARCCAWNERAASAAGTAFRWRENSKARLAKPRALVNGRRHARCVCAFRTAAAAALCTSPPDLAVVQVGRRPLEHSQHRAPPRPPSAHLVARQACPYTVATGRAPHGGAAHGFVSLRARLAAKRTGFVPRPNAAHYIATRGLWGVPGRTTAQQRPAAAPSHTRSPVRQLSITSRVVGGGVERVAAGRWLLCTSTAK